MDLHEYKAKNMVCQQPQPFIAVQIGDKRKNTDAFVDYQADGTAISYDLFKYLKNMNLRKKELYFNPIQDTP